MDVKMFFSLSDNRTINKNLSEEVNFTGEVRSAVNIMEPTIRFYDPSVLRYNYCYIPDFQRYYFINSVNAVANNIYDLTLSVDVLMSFRAEISQYPVIVDKQAEVRNGDEYIDDSSLITDNLMFSTVYNFPSGFLDTPELILITAG